MRQEFTLEWKPAHKERPRVTTVAGRPRMYTAPKTVQSEAAIGWLLRQDGAKIYDRGVPLKVQVTFTVYKPSSARKRDLFPVKRPDLDQYVKLLMDAGNGILWWDDAQIVSLHAVKCYGRPCIHLAVEAMG